MMQLPFPIAEEPDAFAREAGRKLFAGEKDFLKGVVAMSGLPPDDRIEVWREGVPLYVDAVHLTGDLEARMARAALGGGAGAMASLVYVAPDAEAHLAPLREMLPETCGVSLMREDLLILRMLARDSLNLRRSLLPVLDRLSRDTLPTSWRL